MTSYENMPFSSPENTLQSSSYQSLGPVRDVLGQKGPMILRHVRASIN